MDTMPLELDVDTSGDVHLTSPMCSKLVGKILKDFINTCDIFFVKLCTDYPLIYICTHAHCNYINAGFTTCIYIVYIIQFNDDGS